MKSRKNKKTLRSYFVKDTEKTKLQNDKKLTDSFKIISLYIFMFLLQGIFNIYWRDWQFKRNMEIIGKYLTVNKLHLMGRLGSIQFMENVAILTITFIIGIAGLYYFNYKYEKEHSEEQGITTKSAESPLL